MAKLYPPVIEGVIPAFYGNDLVVPYSMNKTVHKDEVAGFSLKIKTVQNNLHLGTLTTIEADGSYSNHSENEARFKFSDELLSKINIGQYYKIQIAYINKAGEVGYYSTVGVVKYTSEPKVTIKGLTPGERNGHLYNYTGHYSQAVDYSEKVSSYNFKMWDGNSNLVLDTGDLIHNVSNDNDTLYNESIDTLLVSQELDQNSSYFIQYTITTNNGLTVSSPRYRIAQKQSVAPELKAQLTVELNYENGYISLGLIGEKNDSGYEKNATGSFALSRCRVDEPGNWQTLLYFSLRGKRPSSWSWKDFTIEQGVEYIYSIQQYNSNNLYSERILSESIYSDFEHAFLFDGERQLKIKYNPKISSFKTSVVESKLETIGSKHPFIFKNGAISYKEFPISGLISYLIDEENLFISDDNFIFSNSAYRADSKPFKEYKRTTNLTSENIQLEREFKINVLDWLNNGKPKIFRSPTEGNYVVRLMNSSLAPNDTLGRMLHTFTSTAYEIADFDNESLSSLGFIGNLDNSKSTVISWSSINLLEKLINTNETDFTENILSNDREALSLSFEGMVAGDQVEITYKDNSKHIIIIGATGSYMVNDILPITSVRLNVNNAKVSGILTYGYESVPKDEFGLYRSAKTLEVPAKQILGSDFDTTKNIMEELEDIKRKVLDVYYVLAEKREVRYIYANSGSDIVVSNGVVNLELSNLYYDRYKQQRIESFDPYDLYQVKISTLNPDDEIQRNQDYYLDADSSLYVSKDEAYIDGFNRKLIQPSNYSTKIFINEKWNEETGIELNEINGYVLENIKPDKIYIGSGVLITIGYCLSCVEYNFENNEDYYNKLNNYRKVLSDYKEEIVDKEAIQKAKEELVDSYNELIKTLEKQLEDYKRENGINE